MKITIPNTQVTLELLIGDITKEETDVIVNAANAYLLRGNGVCGAIFNASKDPESLQKSCKAITDSFAIKTVPIGSAYLTSSFGLKSDFIIHAVGPIYPTYKDKNEAAELLYQTYKNSLDIIKEKNFKSISFPAISTGIFSYPLEDAASIAILACIDSAPEIPSLETIRFVLFDQKTMDAFTSFLTKYNNPSLA